jgi:hypothetical protein
MTQTCLDLIGAGGPILVEGPFSLNRNYLAALAALTKRGVFALAGSTGTSQGAAMLAGGDAAKATPTHVEPLEMEGLPAYRTAWRDQIEA